MKRQLEGYEAPFIYVTSGERFEDCRNGRFTMNFAKVRIMMRYAGFCVLKI